ncbi:hypothetical protein T10_7899, partial [Trichinella papuae]
MEERRKRSWRLTKSTQSRQFAANNAEIDSIENHQEMLYENALKKPNMDNHQLDADKKQIQTNEGIEDIKQDEQAVEAVAKNNPSDVVETVTEQTV